MKLSSLRKLEVGISILLLLFFSGATGQIAPIQATLKIVSYPIILLLIAPRWKRFAYVITRDIPLLLLVVTAVVSVLWSVSPESTLTSGKGLVRTALFAAYLSMRYSLKEQLRLFAWSMGIAALISLFYAVVLPVQGLMPSDGGYAGLWRGAYGHKNHLGRAMTLSAEVFSLQALSSKRYKWLLWGGCGLSVFLVLRSQSATAFFTLVFLSALIPLYKFLQQRQYKLQVVVIIVVIFLSGIIKVLISTNAAAILASQGKDLSFTGRSYLWPVLETYIAERPFLGYGYEGFWEFNGARVAALVGDWAGHAHSGLYETLLHLGLVGVLLFILSLIPALIRTIKKMYLAKDATDFLALQFVILSLVFNFTIESTILSTSNILWIIYVALALSLAIPHPQTSLDHSCSKANSSIKKMDMT